MEIGRDGNKQRQGTRRGPSAHTNHKRQFSSRLTILIQLLPLFGQLGLIWHLISQGRWDFMTLLLPSFLSTLALVVVTLWRTGTRFSQNLAHLSPFSTNQEDRSDPSEADIQELSTLEPEWLESILFTPLSGQETPPPYWQSIVHTWTSTSNHLPSNLAIIGKVKEGIFTIDLAREGPHALVAGTTGSGKSVFLQTWCLSLACRLPPSRLNLVLLDFKGGSGFNLLSKLPQTVGCVNDLDLVQATRALSGIKKELRRREILLASAKVSDTRDLPVPPPQLLVIIDEFQALRHELPEYLDNLTRLASQGRSLGMNLVVCTQHTIGQVGSQMRANMNLDICLRVRDPLQSRELLGSDCAAKIAPSHPGLGFYENGSGIHAFQTSPVHDQGWLIDQIDKAASFCGFRPSPPLFSSPLPSGKSGRKRSPGISSISATLQEDHLEIPIGWMDDGVLLHICRLPLKTHTALIGPDGRGKSTLLHMMATRIKALLSEQDSPDQRPNRQHSGSARKRGYSAYFTAKYGEKYITQALQPVSESDFPLGQGKVNQKEGLASRRRLIWLIDDAKDLLDPLNRTPLAQRTQQYLTRKEVIAVVAVNSIMDIRHPEHYSQRLVFPFGERSLDLSCGIPTSALTGLGQSNGGIPGRCLLMSGGNPIPVQCFPPYFSKNHP